MKVSLQKGVPPLFMNIRGLYKDPEKVSFLLSYSLYFAYEKFSTSVDLSSLLNITMFYFYQTVGQNVEGLVVIIVG